MKRIYTTLFVLLFSSLVYSQTVNTSIKDAHNYRFSLLEKNRVPHQILTDYGYEFIDVGDYDGVLRSNNYMSIARYNEIYNTMVSSVTATTVSGIGDPTVEKGKWRDLQVLANKANYSTNQAKVILSGLSYNYNTFNPNALSQGKIAINNGRYDDKYVGGKWQNPYDNNYTFAVAASVKKITKATVSTQLPATLWHSNTTTHSLEINFGEPGGSYENIKNGAISTHTYTDPGNYTWTYRVSTDGGMSYKYGRQQVTVSFIKDNQQKINQNCPFNETNPQLEFIDAVIPFDGVLGATTLQIVYGSDSCSIENPLIVVEGLDTGLLAEPGDIGDSDIENFLESVDISFSNDLRNLITANGGTDMDVIYVNWDNGVDFLQRNAFALEEVINWVNDNKVTNTPNVILGQSMGGVIARYALRDMENNGVDHDTRLYISHDAPHQGAHVPLGASFMIRHLVDQFIETPLGSINVPLENSELGLGNIGDLLDAPAVNQLLSNTINDQLQLDNTVFDAWQAELQNMGYPQLTRNVALSNGSHCAQSQGFTSNQTLLAASGNGSTSVLTDLLTSYFALGAISSYIFDDINPVLLGILPGGSSLDVNFEVKAFPSSGTARIYDGRITYEKTFLWVLPITTTITDRSFNSPNNVLFQDDFPGGVSPFGGELENSGASASTIFGSVSYNFTIEPNFNFIATTSALDIGGGAAPLTDAIYRDIYTAAAPPTGALASPFDNFTTSFSNNGNNEPHITFNRFNGDWLAAEINPATPVDIFDCSLVCTGDENILGPDKICSSGTYTLAFSAPLVNWVVPTGSDLVTLVQNGNSITVTQNNENNNGRVILAAEVGNSTCGFRTFSKEIYVGTPTLNSLLEVTKQETGLTDPFSPNGGNCEDIAFKLDVSPSLSNVTEIIWDQTSSDFTWSENGTKYVIITPLCNDEHTFRVRLRNNCGLSAWIPLSYTSTSCDNDCSSGPNTGGGSAGSIFEIYPVPANTNLTVKKRDYPTGILNAGDSFNVKIQNSSGLMVFNQNSISNPINIDVSNFIPGFYIVTGNFNGQLESNTIIID